MVQLLLLNSFVFSLLNNLLITSNYLSQMAGSEAMIGIVFYNFPLKFVKPSHNMNESYIGLNSSLEPFLV